MKRRILAFSGLLFIFFFIASCAVNPVTGKRELALISESQEIAMGAEYHPQILSEFGMYDEPALTEYVTRIGQRLVPYTHRPQLTYHFSVLDSPVVNAFAVPGGYIYVTRGILAMMNSEAELAAVLGHELGHVNARHSVRKMSQLMLIQLGLVVGSALSETIADISGYASVGIQLLFLKFSRDDERQADVLGVEYSRKGLYNPAGMVAFFNSLQKLGDLSGGHRLPGFLSTHPLTSERIKNTTGMLMASDNQLAVNKPDYYGQIDNIVFGDDPRQGYVEGQAFYHPMMRFSFSIPEGWKVQNTSAQVALQSESGDAAVILQAEKSSENVRTYAQKKSQEIQGRILHDEKHLTINGLDSFVQYFDVTQENQADLRVILSCIRKDELIYSFYSLSAVDNFSKYDFQFGTVVGSFRELNDPKYLNRQPQRLRIIDASGNQTLRAILQNQGIKEEDLPKFAIMNGMDINQTPGAGQRIKIAR